MPGRERASKLCTVCGREIAWRKKWERDWANVRYCSSACRSARVTPVDAALEAEILLLLRGRPIEASICPSEAARRVAAGSQGGEAIDWRSLMEPARAAARRLVAKGAVEVTQGGRVVDPSTAKGPIRIRRVGRGIA